MNLPLRQGGPPPGVGRYLLPNERLVVAVRQHPALILPPLATAVGGLLSAIVVGGIPHVSRSVQAAVWVLAVFLMLRLVVTTFDWSIRLIVVTNQRFLLMSGLFTRSVQTISFPNLMDMRFDRSPAGRILGFGSFTIQSDASAHAVINFMPYPEQIYLEIFAALYPELAARVEPLGYDDSSDD